MSSDELLNISNRYMLHCGIVWWGVLMERGDVVGYMYLAIIKEINEMSSGYDII